MRLSGILVVLFASLFVGQPDHGPGASGKGIEELRLENAELKLKLASLELKVARLEKALADCRSDSEKPAESERDGRGIWHNAIRLRIESIESISLLPSESDELHRLEGLVQQLETDYDDAKDLADRLEEENRRASRPYRTWDGKLFNPAPPNSPESIREVKGKVARLRIDIRQAEQRAAKLKRFKTTNRVLLTGSHSGHESTVRQVILNGRLAVNSMSLTPGQVIEVQLTPRSSLGSDDAIEGRNYRVVNTYNDIKVEPEG